MKGLNRKVEKKDVSEGTFPVDDTKEEVTVDTLWAGSRLSTYIRHTFFHSLPTNYSFWQILVFFNIYI